MSYSYERVQSEFREICRSAGAPSGENIPIKLNGRLARTLGRVTYERDTDGSIYPTLVEFSKKLIETSTDKSIVEVIRHEAAHLITVDRTGESHGHDAVFKSVCAEIGAAFNGAETEVERTVPEKQLHKYSIYCHTCHEYIDHYDRMCKTIKNIHSCSCAVCHSRDLTVVQNW